VVFPLIASQKKAQMNKRYLLPLIGLVFTCFCLFYFDSSRAQNIAHEETGPSSAGPLELFSLVGTQRPRSAVSLGGVREQDIKVNFEMDLEKVSKLRLPLLDGKTYEASRRESEGFVRFGPDEYSWRGKIYAANDWSGDVILTFKGKALSGLIYSPVAVYEIIPQANLKHLLIELDQSRFPSCGGAIRVDQPPEDRAEANELEIRTPPPESNTRGSEDSLFTDSPAAPLVDDGSQIDVLVTYTAQVRAALGGTTQAQAFAQQAVTSTNTAYQNSNINPRLRLVGTLEVSYNESAGTLAAALPWLRTDATVAAARDSTKADMVSIIIEDASDGCGLGYIMTNVGPQFAGSAFSAVLRSCAVGNLSFAHELGHNQGSDHNPENANPPGSLAYPYAFGHFVNGSFRTVMSYADPCTSGCNRVAYFSNPAITFNGFATGITNQRDNHRVLNNTALTVSQFRTSGGGTGTSPNLTPFQPTGWSDKIVVSTQTGTNTDSTPLRPTDTLYIDWAVINNGTAATGAAFTTKLFVDGVERNAWSTAPPLNTNTYSSVQDYSLGTLSVGSHTIQIITDTNGSVSESNEADNQYTKTISVTSTAQLNLTPFQPTGWSDKIVVSNQTGTSTDSNPLGTTDTLYVDWAVINSGPSATGVRFHTKLFVDGVERNSWFTDPPLNVNFYVYVQDYSIGTLSAGTHTIRISTDATGTISETNELDNDYTKTITIASPAQPNLTPYQPTGWSDKIVVSNATGTNLDSSPIRPTDTLYVDWAVANIGSVGTSATFYTKLLVDGVERTSWFTSPPLNQNFYVFVADYSIGSLGVGTHTIKIVTDATGVISEGSESDNEYTKTITVTAPALNTFQFSAASYSVNEGGGSMAVSVTRSGDISGWATIDYMTSDGTATQSKDYTIGAGRVNFAAGETNKTFTLLISDDVFAEASESINLSLSNPSAGMSLGSPSAVATMITDNDTGSPSTNPLDNSDARFFVRQHYYDFLSRVPDVSGYDYWSGQITQCGSNAACRLTKSIDVSNAFYFEQEFQQTGSYVYRLYRAAFGNSQPFPNPNPDPAHPGEQNKVPLYTPFMRDRAQVRGGAQLPQLQLDLANAFILRGEFTNRYSISSSGPAFVDAILATIKIDIGPDLASQRTALINLFNAGGRGAVLYRLADDNLVTNPINNRAFIDAEYNRAFVFTQYAGYLRRNADMAGLLFWLGQVNGAPLRDLSKQNAMVCSFITSTEYQQRFSSIVTHSNAQCGP
jgi:peptidyl-Asp metalloendopeptidase